MNKIFYFIKVSKKTYFYKRQTIIVLYYSKKKKFCGAKQLKKVKRFNEL